VTTYDTFLAPHPCPAKCGRQAHYGRFVCDECWRHLAPRGGVTPLQKRFFTAWDLPPGNPQRSEAMRDVLATLEQYRHDVADRRYRTGVRP